MTKNKSFYCNKKVSEDIKGKRVRSPYCGSKMLFKARSTITKVKAR